MMPKTDQDSSPLDSPTLLHASPIPDPTVPSTPSNPWSPGPAVSIHEARGVLRSPVILTDTRPFDQVGMPGYDSDAGEQTERPRGATPRASQIHRQPIDQIISRNPSIDQNLYSPTNPTNRVTMANLVRHVPPRPPGSVPPPPPVDGRDAKPPSNLSPHGNSTSTPPPPPPVVTGDSFVPASVAVLNIPPPPVSTLNIPLPSIDGFPPPAPPVSIPPIRPTGEVRISSSVVPPPLAPGGPPPPEQRHVTFQSRPPAPSPDGKHLGGPSKNAQFTPPPLPPPPPPVSQHQHTSSLPRTVSILPPPPPDASIHGVPPDINDIPPPPPDLPRIIDDPHATIRRTSSMDKRRPALPLSPDPAPYEAAVAFDYNREDVTLTPRPSTVVPPRVPTAINHNELQPPPPPSGPPPAVITLLPPLSGPLPVPIDVPPPPPPLQAPAKSQVPPPLPLSSLSQSREDIPPPPPPSGPSVPVTIPPPPPAPLETITPPPTTSTHIPPPPPPSDPREIPPPESQISPHDVPPPPPPPLVSPLMPSGTPTLPPHPYANFVPPPPPPDYVAGRSSTMTSNHNSALFDQDEVEELRRGETYDFPPVGPRTTNHRENGRKRTAAVITNMQSILAPEDLHNDITTLSRSSTGSMVGQSTEKVQAMWKALKKKRHEIYDLRGKMAKQRVRLRELRQNEDDAMYKLVNYFMISDSNSAVNKENTPETMELLFTNLQTARTEFQREQESYDERDRELDDVEEKVADMEDRFFNLLTGIGGNEKPEPEKSEPTPEEEEVPYELMGISGDLAPTSLPTAYTELEDCIADFNANFEELHNLDNNVLEIRGEIQRMRLVNPYYRLDEFKSEMLETYPAQRDIFTKEYDTSRNAVISKLSECIEKEQMPDLTFVPLDILFSLYDKFNTHIKDWLSKQSCNTNNIATTTELDLFEPQTDEEACQHLSFPFLASREWNFRALDGFLPDLRAEEGQPPKFRWENEFKLGKYAELVGFHAPKTTPATKLGEGQSIGNWYIVTSWLEYQLRSSVMHALLLENCYRWRVRKMKLRPMPRNVWERKVPRKWYADETRRIARDGKLYAPETPPVTANEGHDDTEDMEYMNFSFVSEQNEREMGPDEDGVSKKTSESVQTQENDSVGGGILLDGDNTGEED